MYKRKLCKWNLSKKVRPSELTHIVHKMAERKKNDKESIFTVRGLPVCSKAIARYMKRKGIAEEEILPLETPRPVTPIGIRCFTPESVSELVLCL